jgi:DNA (cytosine-5)-methyltransferase 1
MSPSKQRGRDFAIILSCLMKLGYCVEWKVVNAADYGMPQKRKRIFIFASKSEMGLLDKSFPQIKNLTHQINIEKDILKVSDAFGKNKEDFFYDYGIAKDFKLTTYKTNPNFNGDSTVLKDIILDNESVPPSFFISDDELENWKPSKNGRRLERTSKDGHKYIYAEGKMSFPDSLDKPARTIITGEGGAKPSRFKHVVCISGKFRRLTPIELERAQMFPYNHTQGFTDVQRAFSWEMLW